MSAPIIEIRWTPELRAELVRWILNEAQLPTIEQADMATPEMCGLTALRRKRSAIMKVQSLRTLLETATLPVLDCEIMDAVHRLRLVNGAEDRA